MLFPMLMQMPLGSVSLSLSLSFSLALSFSFSLAPSGQVFGACTVWMTRTEILRIQVRTGSNRAAQSLHTRASYSHMLASYCWLLGSLHENLFIHERWKGPLLCNTCYKEAIPNLLQREWNDLAWVIEVTLHSHWPFRISSMILSLYIPTNYYRIRHGQCVRYLLEYILVFFLKFCNLQFWERENDGGKFSNG